MGLNGYDEGRAALMAKARGLLPSMDGPPPGESLAFWRDKRNQRRVLFALAHCMQGFTGPLDAIAVEAARANACTLNEALDVFDDDTLRALVGYLVRLA